MPSLAFEHKMNGMVDLMVGPLVGPMVDPLVDPLVSLMVDPWREVDIGKSGKP